MSKKIRPSFEEIYMSMACSLSQRSTCHRLNVGTVIASKDFRYVFAVGYNGNATGLPNECDRPTPGNCGCLHAEMNAIINCKTARDVPKVVFNTHIPCEGCAKGLINLGGVEKVYYFKEYRSQVGKDLLQSVGIIVEQLTLQQVTTDLVN